MNFRLTSALFAGAVVLVAGLLISVVTNDDRPAADAALLEPLAGAGLRDKDVDTVEITRTEPAAGKLVFGKGADGKWEGREPAGARVDGFAVDAAVRDLFRAKPVASGSRTDNAALHGLDKPTLSVTLKSGEKSATVHVGLSTIGGDIAETFVSTGDRPAVPVAVRRADLAGLFRDGKDTAGPAGPQAKWLSDYRSRRLFTADLRDPAAEAKAVKLTSGGKDVALSKGANGAWLFTAPANLGEADVAGASEPSPDTFTGVRPLLNALAGLSAGGPDDFVEEPGDPGQYGLAAGGPDLVRVELTPASGPAETVLFGKRVGEAGKPAKVYARHDGDPAVLKIQTDKLDAVRNVIADPAGLRNRDILPETFRDRADALDITVGGTTAKLRKVAVGADRRWVLYGGPGDPRPANQAAVTDLLATLTKPRSATDVLTVPYNDAFVPAERKAELKVWAGGVEAGKADGDKLPPEPKLKGSPAELVFGARATDGVFVRRAGDGVSQADLKVPDAVLAAAGRPRAGYLDYKVPGFDLTKATSLKFNRGSEAYDLVRTDAADYPKGKWTFNAPVARKGQVAEADAANALVGVLSTLAPVKVVADAPSAEELGKFGLGKDAPRTRVAVGLKDDKDKERVYRFGAEADVGYVYAQAGDDPVVFTAPKAAVGRFETDDLRELVLYRLDPAQVTGVKVRSRFGQSGVTTLEFEKLPAGWAAKTPPTPAGYSPDPARIAALVAAAAAPKVVAFSGPGKPEYGVFVEGNPDAREITLTTASGPPTTLVLGAKSPDGRGVYAGSSVILGENVVLDPAAIRPLVETPDALKK